MPGPLCWGGVCGCLPELRELDRVGHCLVSRVVRVKVIAAVVDGVHRLRIRRDRPR